MHLKIVFAGIAMVGLSACAGETSDALRSSCMTIMQDPEVSEEIVDAGISAEAYCDCTVSSFAAMPEADNDRFSAGMIAMAEAMGRTNGSAEEAFRLMRETARADDATPEDVALYEDMRDLGEILEGIVDNMEDIGGVCPAG